MWYYLGISENQLHFYTSFAGPVENGTVEEDILDMFKSQKKIKIIWMAISLIAALSLIILTLAPAFFY